MIYHDIPIYSGKHMTVVFGNFVSVHTALHTVTQCCYNINVIKSVVLSIDTVTFGITQKLTF